MNFRFKIGIVVLLLIMTSVYFVYEDSLPPRTPRKIARLISGLNISRETKCEKPIDSWTENGDGEVLVKGILTEMELETLIEEAKVKSYKTLPINDDPDASIIPDDLKKVQNGFYRLDIDRVDHRGYNLTVIDVDNKELITYLNVL